MFVSGICRSAQAIAGVADLAGGEALATVVRNGGYLAFASALVGGPLLLGDLHTPRRWCKMLRIFRKTSPMSIGTWVLISFSSCWRRGTPRQDGRASIFDLPEPTPHRGRHCDERKPMPRGGRRSRPRSRGPTG
jgi:hypothetical protein